MAKKISKSSVIKKIDEFFSYPNSKTPKEVRKMKRLSMSQNINLRDKRKLFCKKCLMPYKSSEIRIKKGFKSIKCKNCETINRWKIKTKSS